MTARRVEKCGGCQAGGSNKERQRRKEGHGTTRELSRQRQEGHEEDGTIRGKGGERGVSGRSGAQIEKKVSAKGPR